MTGGQIERERDVMAVCLIASQLVQLVKNRKKRERERVCERKFVSITKERDRLSRWN